MKQCSSASLSARQTSSRSSTPTPPIISSPNMVSRASLTLEPRPGLHVEVANGDHVADGGLCRGMPLHIAREHFKVDNLAIPLESFDIVLGVQWLRTINSTTFACHSGVRTAALLGTAWLLHARQSAWPHAPMKSFWTPCCWSSRASSRNPWAFPQRAPLTTRSISCRARHRWR